MIKTISMMRAQDITEKHYEKPMGHYLAYDYKNQRHIAIHNSFDQVYIEKFDTEEKARNWLENSTATAPDVNKKFEDNIYHTITAGTIRAPEVTVASKIAVETPLDRMLQLQQAYVNLKGEGLYSVDDDYIHLSKTGFLSHFTSYDVKPLEQSDYVHLSATYKGMEFVTLIPKSEWEDDK